MMAVAIKRAATPLIPLRSKASLVGFKAPATLANYLRGSHNQLTQADRDYLADYIEGKIKRRAGRPNTTFLFDRMSLAVTIAECYRAAWRKKYGRKHTITLRNGKTYNLRDEMCRRAAVRYNQVYGPSFGNVTKDGDEISAQLRRAKKRRR
jgi:hypothetical protein